MQWVLNHKQRMEGKKAKMQFQDRKQTLLWSHRCRHWSFIAAFHPFFLKGAIIPAIQPFCLTKTISFSPYILSLNRWGLTQVCPTLWPGWTTACHAPLSMELSRKNAGLSCHCQLQGVFLTQGSNLYLLYWQANYLSLSHLGPCIIHWVFTIMSCLFFTFSFHFHALEKEMATHSSVLAWRIPGTGEPGGLPSMGSLRVGHTEVT